MGILLQVQLRRCCWSCRRCSCVRPARATTLLPTLRAHAWLSRIASHSPGTLSQVSLGVMQADSAERRESAGPGGHRAPPRCGSLRRLYDETAELAERRAQRDEQLTDLRARKRFPTLAAF